MHLPDKFDTSTEAGVIEALKLSAVLATRMGHMDPEQFQAVINYLNMKRATHSVYATSTEAY